LTPKEAYEKYIEVKKRMDNISIVGFAGPGDPMANFDKVRETVELIKKNDKEVNFCLSTNGLLISEYIEEIIKAGFLYITVTINAVEGRTGSEIYDYVIHKDKIHTEDTGAEILLEEQWKGLALLASRGIICKVNTLYLKGINDTEIEEIARLAGQKGAYIMNIKNLIPAEGSKFEHIEVASSQEINEMRKACSGYINQMYHCQQCRADSVGLLEEDRFKEFY
jgi:MoaA/NifB/PqqE/SkfB family radical SAM enzyme